MTDKPARFLLGAATKNDLLDLVRAIDDRLPCKSTTEDLIQTLGWPRADVLAGLREARMRGLIVGKVLKLSTVELCEITVTSAARTYLRRNAMSSERSAL